MSTRKVLVGVAVVSLLAVSGLAVAQIGGRMGRGGGGSGRRGSGDPGDVRQRRDPEQMRQMMMERIKEAIRASDEEWKVLEPRVERVMTLSREAYAGRGLMFRGRRGDEDRRPPGAGRAQRGADSPVARAAEELQRTLDNPEATPDQIKAKLTALRTAREQAGQELAKAREAVRELVTQRQEAQLVLMGILD